MYGHFFTACVVLCSTSLYAQVKDEHWIPRSVAIPQDIELLAAGASETVNLVAGYERAYLAGWYACGRQPLSMQESYSEFLRSTAARDSIMLRGISDGWHARCAFRETGTSRDEKQFVRAGADIVLPSLELSNELQPPKSVVVPKNIDTWRIYAAQSGKQRLVSPSDFYRGQYCEAWKTILFNYGVSKKPLLECRNRIIVVALPKTLQDIDRSAGFKDCEKLLSLMCLIFPEDSVRQCAANSLDEQDKSAMAEVILSNTILTNSENTGRERIPQMLLDEDRKN